MIYITGDIHGGASKNKMNKLFNMNLQPEDYLIITGDFGYIWYDLQQDSDGEIIDINHYFVAGLQKIVKAKILFIDGNHENFNRLEQYSVSEWKGGKVHHINNQVIHLMRGQVFEIEDLVFFTFGGAQSTDKWHRTMNVSLWEQEVPNAAEREEGYKNFVENIDRINYVLTHETTETFLNLLPITRINEPGYDFREYLDSLYQLIKDKPQFKKWFFGHFHLDLRLDKKVRVIYNDILDLPKLKNKGE